MNDGNLKLWLWWCCFDIISATTVCGIIACFIDPQDVLGMMLLAAGIKGAVWAIAWTVIGLHGLYRGIKDVHSQNV